MTEERRDLELQMFVPLISDGALAGPFADGRLVPVLILDTSQHPDVREFIRVSAHLGGDSSIQWGISDDDEDSVSLILNVTNPLEVEFAVGFSIEKQGLLIEMILEAACVGIQSGSVGDRLAEKIDSPRVNIDVPDCEFNRIWPNLFRSRLVKTFVDRGVPAGQNAEAAADDMIREFKKMVAFRLRT